MTQGNASDVRTYGEGSGPNPTLGSLDRLGGTFEDDPVAGRWEWAQDAEEMAQDAVMIRTGES